MMPAAVVLKYLHACESHAVSQVQFDRTYVAIGFGGGFADNLAQLVCFHDPHQDYTCEDICLNNRKKIRVFFISTFYSSLKRQVSVYGMLVVMLRAD